MIPDPLHPAIVHFPIVLAVLFPAIAATVFWAIQFRRIPGRSWLFIVVLQAVLVGSAWAALETGEHEEERAERVVAERYLEEHEEVAERFMLLAGLVLPLAAAGLLSGPVGAINRALTIALSLGVLGAVAATGHSGGELVYRHGAAGIYSQPDLALAETSRSLFEHSGHHQDEHEDEHEDDDD